MGDEQHGGRRKKGVQHVFDVVRTERIAPQLIRVHLGGPAFETFVTGADPERLAATDKYVKLLFARPELGLEPPYDLETLRETLSPEDLPVRRTYTVRSIDHGEQTLAIDFVVHGDEGVAGPWAASAEPGDRLCLSGPGGKYSPAEDHTHVLIADDSAIPAVAAALEALPESAHGIALIEVADAASHAELTHPDGVEVRWIHRDGAAYGAPLVDAVVALERPAGPVDVFAHGERGAMKSIARHLIDAWGVARRDMSISAYWAHGRSEDGFQAEKREPVGQILPAE